MKRSDFEFMVKAFENTSVTLTGNFIEDYERIMRCNECHGCHYFKECGSSISGSRLAHAGMCNVRNSRVFTQARNK